MSERSDTLLLKAIARNLLEPIWKSEFYSDAEDHIQYRDADTRQNPRPESEINKINDELNRLMNDVLDEIVDDLQQNGLTTFESISKNVTLARDICHRRFWEYRRKLWDVVRTEFPAKRL